MPAFAFSEASPWGRCLSYFLASCSKSHSAETVKVYRTHLYRFLSTSAMGETKMPDVMTREDVMHFLYSPSAAKFNRGQAVGPSCINQRLACVRQFYEFARNFEVQGADGQLAALMQRANPTAGIAHLDTPRRYRGMSYEEYQKLLAIIPTETVKGMRDRAIVLLYFWTARRRAEISALRWGDIEASSGVPSGYIFRFYGKGKSTVQDAAELPRPAYDALIAYLEVSGRQTGMTPDSPLFVGLTGRGSERRGLHKVTINALVTGYIKEAGLQDGRRLTLHSLRHTAAQEHDRAGVKLQDIQRLLRHHDPATTIGYLELASGIADPGLPLLEARYRMMEGKDEL